MKSQRLLSIVLAGVLLCGMAASSLWAPAKAEEPSSWAQSEIYALRDKNVVRRSLLGDYVLPSTRLRFTQALSDMVQYLALVQNVEYNLYSQLTTFTDCTDLDVLRANKYKIVGGTSKTQFSPYQYLTRETAIVLLYRALLFVAPQKATPKPGRTGLSGFSDAKQTSSWAVDAMDAMIKLGFVKGDKGKCTPQARLSNQESLLLIYRVLKYVAADSRVKAPAVTPTPVVTPTIEYQRTCLISGNRNIQIGDSVGKLVSTWGSTKRRITSSQGFEWYVYHERYTNFAMIGVFNDKVVAFYALGQFSVMGSHGSNRIDYFTDYGGGYRTYACRVISEPSRFAFATKPSAAQLAGSEAVFYEILNAFRVYNGKAPLVYSSSVSNVSRAHSRDMAARKFYSTTSISGSKPDDRLRSAGVKFWMCREAVQAGGSMRDGIEAFNSVVYSSTNRNQILDNSMFGFDAVGVGITYAASSTYGYYCTMDLVDLK